MILSLWGGWAGCSPYQATRRLALMPVSPGFRDFLLDQLAGLGDLTAKAMFGGLGLYQGDRFFGIVVNDVAYFKVGEGNRRDYERAGMRPFKPYRDRPMTMRYFQVPLSVLEDPDELVSWARKAVVAAEGDKPTRKRRLSRR
jgi:DNA transformation protein